MISRFVCGVVAMAMAGPCLGQAPVKTLSLTNLRSAELDSFGVTIAENLQVTGVEPGSAADEMGLKVGDMIRDVNGLGFGNPDQFARVLRAIPSQRVVRVVVSRNGSPVRLAGRLHQPTNETTGIRTVSQTVVSGMSTSGCGNCGSTCSNACNACRPCSSGCSTCGPCGYGPGTQWLNQNCGGPRLDLSNGIGLCDPCNCWGANPSYCRGCCW